jgi:hypothetical protein
VTDTAPWRDGGDHEAATSPPILSENFVNPNTPHNSSKALSWWSVHEHVQPLLDEVDGWPMVGTPAWCALPDDDPAKLASLLDAAQHHALRVETCQEQQAQASRDVSAAADWPAIGTEMHERARFYCEHPYLRRRRDG